MNIYLAASYSRRNDMVGHADQLERLGHRITSSWIDGHHEKGRGKGIDLVASEVEQAGWAAEDLADLARSDCLIAFTATYGRNGHERGGRHVEFGIALARGLRLIVVGSRQNVFHCLPQVEQYNDLSDMVDAWRVREASE